jgi:hypothetical protein
VSHSIAWASRRSRVASCFASTSQSTYSRCWPGVSLAQVARAFALFFSAAARYDGAFGGGFFRCARFGRSPDSFRATASFTTRTMTMSGGSSDFAWYRRPPIPSFASFGNMRSASAPSLSRISRSLQNPNATCFLNAAIMATMPSRSKVGTPHLIFSSIFGLPLCMSLRRCLRIGFAKSLDFAM